MSVFDEAVKFATDAHAGTFRKRDGSPYITHPMEVAVIAATLTDDPEVLAAAVLHDTVEDAGVSVGEIRERFGDRVARLVASETENKRPEMSPEESWQIRKEESLAMLRDASDPGTKIMWLSDKLANMRSFFRLWIKEGDGIWVYFHQPDPARQAWYYRSILEYTGEFSDSFAWLEYRDLTKRVFEGVK